MSSGWFETLSSADPPTAAAVPAGIRDVLERRLAAGHAPGAVVAVTDRHRTLAVLDAGLADAAAERRYDGDSLIRLDSLSKPLVALVTLQEMERGTLALDTPIPDLLPWCELPPSPKPITVHHLMSHTAGLPRGSDTWLDPLFPVHRLRALRPVGTPGEQFHYSNHGWKLLGLLLEELTGRPLSDLLRERILEPLGMASSRARLEPRDISELVPRYCRVRPGRPVLADLPLAQIPWPPHAAADGCVAASVDDVCRFARAMLQHGATPDGGRLVAPDTFNLLVERWAQEDEVGWYGYGWWIYERRGQTFYMHPGYQPGSACILILDPVSGIAVFVAANGLLDVRTIAEYCLASVRAAADGSAPPQPPRTRRAERIPSAEDYVGEYHGASTFTLALEGDGLRFHGAGLDQLLQRVDPQVQSAFPADTFVLPSFPFDDHYLEFERSADGVVTGVHHGARRFDRGMHRLDATPLPADWDAFCGDYRSQNPLDPSITVVGRRGRLWLLEEWETVELHPLGGGEFRVGSWEQSPEYLVFDAPTPHGTARVRTGDGEGVWYRISA
ncbi:MAG: serine hydrolase [Catenulispora sp.]|nr:serine hydrolase [Catenulispora sp.]